MSRLFVLLQPFLPQHFLSRFIGFFAERAFLKDFFIRAFIRRYKVDMTESAISDPAAYPNFNSFFTRELKPDARRIIEKRNAVVCPADGKISALGAIQKGKLLQAKNREFKLIELLGGDEALTEEFLEGSFATVYLSPRDYHRVHLPLAGRLLKTIYVPGRLFSVNKVTTDSVSNLFARNERAICVFKTTMGYMCVILVGALIVASIETIWAGQLRSWSRKQAVTVTDYNNHEPPIELAAGMEMGRFKLGSTVITLFPPRTVELNKSLEANSPVKMGQMLGKLLQPN